MELLSEHNDIPLVGDRVCTLLKMEVTELGLRYKFRNQDRHSAIRFRLWEEGWWKPWIPQFVLGTNNPNTSAHKEGYATSTSQTRNNYWNQYYPTVTKHLR